MAAWGEQLVIRLWETLAEKGIGKLLTPWQEKREGTARIKLRQTELVMLAQAERDAADVRAGRKNLLSDGSLVNVDGNSETPVFQLEMQDRIEPVLGLQQAAMNAALSNAAESARLEINVAKSIIHAEAILANDKELPTNTKIDDDWLFTWQEYASKISRDELQRLWGSVLAGEVKSPGKYSVRTLDFLKTLSKDEADLIALLAKYVVNTSLVFRTENDYFESQGLPFYKLLQLQEIGVLSGVDGIGLTTSYTTLKNGTFIQVLKSNGKVIVIEHADETKEFAQKIYQLTGVGQQIISLGSFEPDVSFLRSVGKTIASKGFSVQLGDWLQVTADSGNCLNPENLTS